MKGLKVLLFHSFAGLIVAGLALLFYSVGGIMVVSAFAGSVAIIFREAGEAEKNVPGEYPKRVEAIALYLLKPNIIWQWLFPMLFLFFVAFLW